MDVDNDFDQHLLQQFSSMGTTDKEVLIAELQKLLGNQLNPAGCAFFLDMNNWNLQAAIGAYYDYEQPKDKVPSMAFIKDVTIGEGESVPPNTRFIKTWRIQNTGIEDWPPGCCLKFVGGEQFGHRERAMVEAVQIGQMTDISIEMVSPPSTGIYQGQWRMTTPTGMYFGEIIWVILAVEENGLLGVTQQMSQFGADFSQSPHSAPVNPFASPVKAENELNTSIFSPASPNHSVIAQNGSDPNSPQLHSLSPISPHSSLVRTSLFQLSPNEHSHTALGVDGIHTIEEQDEMS